MQNGIQKVKDSISTAINEVRERFGAACDEILVKQESEAAKLAKELDVIDGFERHSKQKAQAEATLQTLQTALNTFQENHSTPLIGAAVDEIIRDMGSPFASDNISPDRFRPLLTLLALGDAAKKYTPVIIADFTKKHVAVRRQNLENYKAENAEILQKHKLV